MRVNRRRKVDITRLFWCREGEPVDNAAPEVSGTAADPSESGVSATVDVGTSTEEVKPALDWNTIIPEDLREEETFKNILKNENPGAEMAKQLANAQKMIGKKGVVPAADASDEEWAEFYTKVRPEKADEYEIGPVDLGEEKKTLAERINSYRSDESLNKAKEIFHKHGLSKRQAEGLAKDWELYQAQEFEQLYKQSEEFQKQADAHWDTLASKMFGGSKERMTKAGEDFVKAYTTDEERAILKSLPDEKLPDEALMVMSILATRMQKKYEGQDDFDPNTKPSAGETSEQIAKQIHELMQHPDYLNPMSQNQDRIAKQIDELQHKRVALAKKEAQR